MFASNFPVDKLFSDYGTLWNAFRECTNNLSASEQHNLFFDIARRFYRIDLE